MDRRNLSSRRFPGFTLVEVIGVLAILALLTAFLIPRIFQTINTARVHSAAAVVRQVKNAVASHYAKYGGLANSTGSLFNPANVAADADAAHFDLNVLMKDGMLGKRFSVKIGDQISATNRVVVRQVAPAANAAVITPDSANYDLDATGEIETNAGAVLCECVITGVSAADALGLKVQIDGAPIVGDLDVGEAATNGRVKYPAIGGGATGEVHVYINHQ